MTQQPPDCPPVSSPNPEWDECVRAGSWTIGFGTILGAIATVFVGSETPIIIGTGLGVAWSIKRCRYLLRIKQARDVGEECVCPESSIPSYKQLPAPEAKDKICAYDKPVAKIPEKKSSRRLFFFGPKAVEEEKVKQPLPIKEEIDSCHNSQLSPIVCDAPLNTETCDVQPPSPCEEPPPCPAESNVKTVPPIENECSPPPPPVDDTCGEASQPEETFDSAPVVEQEETAKEKFTCCGRRPPADVDLVPPPAIDQPPPSNNESNEQLMIPCIQEHDSCGNRVYENPSVSECTCPPPVSYTCSCPPPQTEICTCNATPCPPEELTNHVKFTWPPLLTFAQVKKPLECTCPPTKQQAQQVCTCQDDNCN